MATINDAVREMYLTQTGREADPGGLQYFADRFGSSIEPDELAIFRQMAADEVAGQEARQAAAAQQAAALAAQQQQQQIAQQQAQRVAQQQAEDLARYMAEMQQVRESEARGQEARQAAAAAQQQAAQQAAAEASAATAGTTAVAQPLTNEAVRQAYLTVLGREPDAAGLKYFSDRFGAEVDPTELSTFSVMAQPELAARPTTNDAIRQMYLSVLGREPDASGLKYFSDRFGTDVDTGELDIFKGMSTQEINANAARNVGTTTTGTTRTGTTTSLTGTGTPGTTTGATTRTGATTGTVQPITRPPPIRQVTSSQLAPASFAQTAIAATPFTNVYTPATMQQNAPRLSDIQAAAQSANPYQSLMSLTPQRTLSPAYAAQAGQTTANTNLGGYDSSLYSQPLTGLLAPSTVAGGGGADGVNNSSGDYGGSNTGSGQTGYGTVANLAGEAQRYGFNNLGGLIAGAIPVGGTYNRTDLTTGLPVTGSFTTADLAALGNRDAIAAMTAQNQAIAQDAEQQSSSSGFDGYGGIGGVTGGSDTMGFGGEYAKGGMVNMRPQMHNPPGPDDGYAALDNGEYVIRKKAVKKYGSNIFEQINAGKIPAQRLKSLLE